MNKAKQFTHVPKDLVKNIYEKSKDNQSKQVINVSANNSKYPLFNTCDHYLVDMSDMKCGNDENWMNTISIKLPNNQYVTLCVIKSADDQACVDVNFSGVESKTWAMGFKNGRTKTIEDMGLYTVVSSTKQQ